MYVCMYVCMSTFSNIFSSETTMPIKVKFYIEFLWDGGTKVCSTGPGHMTKMPPCPYMVKTLKIFFSGTKRPMTLKLGMLHQVLMYYEVCSHDDPRLTLIYFTARSKLVPYAFVWEKGKTMEFSETIVVYDVKVGSCSKLNDYMSLNEYQGHSLTLVQGHADSTFQNSFFLVTAWPIEAKFKNVEPPWDVGTKVWSTGLDHMTQIIVMPIYGKNLQKSSSLETKDRWPWKLVCNIGYSSTTKFVQKMTLVDLDLLYGKGGPLCFCMGER